MTTQQQVAQPFKCTTIDPKAIVIFSVERITHVAIGKRAAKLFLEELLGVKEAELAMKRKFFYVDNEENAIHCVKILKGLKDFHVSQFVFGARAFKAIP